jgi:D-threonate/D-erythronate kinase
VVRSVSFRSLVVTADDTTGALESAAQAADCGWAAVVVPHSLPTLVDDRAAPSLVVVDLRSRHETAGVAADRLRSVLRPDSAGPTGAFHVRVHKIDSTLRGNWPAELAAAVAVGRRVLMLPAFPAAGRICVGGVVTEHGRPVDQTVHVLDPRSPALTSRPAMLLDGADELAGPVAVANWLAGATRVAVADAADDGDVARVVELACAHDDVLIVGTAAVVGAVAKQVWQTQGRPPPVGRASGEALTAPVLVVCGSLHPVSRRQIRSLIEAGASVIDASNPAATPVTSSVAILMSDIERTGDAALVAARLAEQAHVALRSMGAATVVLLGGDTAQAFIGDREVRVRGSLDVGVAVGAIVIDDKPHALVAKPGAFGAPNTLVDLMNVAPIPSPWP